MCPYLIGGHEWDRKFRICDFYPRARLVGWNVSDGIGIQFHILFGSQTCQMNLISKMQNDTMSVWFHTLFGWHEMEMESNSIFCWVRRHVR